MRKFLESVKSTPVGVQEPQFMAIMANIENIKITVTFSGFPL